MKTNLCRFPKDESRKNLWKIACGITLCLSSYKVCSDHFSPDDYELNGYLKKDAIPWYYFIFIFIFTL